MGRTGRPRRGPPTPWPISAPAVVELDKAQSDGIDRLAIRRSTHMPAGQSPVLPTRPRARRPSGRGCCSPYGCAGAGRPRGGEPLYRAELVQPSGGVWNPPVSVRIRSRASPRSCSCSMTRIGLPTVPQWIGNGAAASSCLMSGNSTRSSLSRCNSSSSRSPAKVAEVPQLGVPCAVGRDHLVESRQAGQLAAEVGVVGRHDVVGQLTAASARNRRDRAPCPRRGDRSRRSRTRPGGRRATRSHASASGLAPWRQ